MRKILFIILIILLLVGAGLIIANGMEIGNFEIWGVKSITAQNETIDRKNLELSNLVSITYPSSLSELSNTSETLTTTKEEYENKAILVSNSKYYMQTEKYEIEYLWTKLGNYAKDNKVQIKIDVLNSSAEGLYDLNFSIAGEYVNVTQFIYDVENDSKLGFKIEDFHMSSVEGGVQGNFACKEIGINIENIDGNLEEVQEESESETPPEDVVPETDNTVAEENTQKTTNEVTENTTTEGE